MKPLLAVLAASIPVVAWTASSSLDEQFFYDAAESGIAEVSNANLARKRSTDHAIERLADAVIKDQTAANDKLQSLAVSEMVDLPSHTGIKQSAEHAKLELIDTNSFDHQYVQGQIKADHDAIALYEQEAESGKDPKARSFAQEMLPMLKKRLEDARKVAARTGANIS
jgi:putative membrane protein